MAAPYGRIDPRSADHWRMRAEEIRALAADFRHPEVKAIMLRIAGDYDRLAKLAAENPFDEAFASYLERTVADCEQLMEQRWQ